MEVIVLKSNPISSEVNRNFFSDFIGSKLNLSHYKFTIIFFTELIN